MINYDISHKNNISVVVPFYNRSVFLERILNSISKQLLKPQEIYIVDNGSSIEESYKAWRILKSHSLFDICTYVSSINIGNANFARNLGFNLSKTNYVAFLDSDDWWNKNHLSESVRALKKTNMAAVYSAAIIHMPAFVKINRSIDVNFFDNPFSLVLSEKGYLAQTSSYVVCKNELIGKVLWDERLKRHQDFDYFAQIFFQTKGWVFLDQANVNVDWDNGGASKKYIDSSSLIFFYEKWNSFIPEKIKKSYLLGMLRFSYKSGSRIDLRKYYHKKIIAENYFGDSFYRFKSSKIAVCFYLLVVCFLDVFRFKEFVRIFINKF